MHEGLRIGRIAGVDIRIDRSLLIIFVLILFGLGLGLLPAWHPTWPAGLIWATALLATLAFFASVLVHELAHALVGRAQGARVPKITLFVFGGMAHLEREPAHWRGELWMALVGPLTSLALGFLCLLAVGRLIDPSALADGGAREVLAELGPAATLLLWLGQINVLLGLFNLVPGYPLDGGRALRAVLWGITGNPQRATRWAAGMGQLFAWLLILMGTGMVLGLRVPVFGSGLLSGLWIALIGWFLNNAAVMSYRQQLIDHSLAGVPARRLMQTDFVALAPELPLQRWIDEWVLHSGQRAFPVLRDGELLGLVCLSDLARVPAARRAALTVADIMTPRERLTVAGPETSADQVLQRLAQAQVNQLPVVEHGRLLGLVSRESLLRWLALRGGLDGRDRSLLER